MKLNKAAAVVLAGTFISVAGYSATVPMQVQAKASYKVQITKNAYVYTSKGKKTKTVYKKKKVLTAYKVRKIKGKYYYDLGKGKYVRTSYAKKYYYRTTTQSKKLVRTIKLYQPTGKKTIKQNAYVKRTVKTNLKTHKKTYGKWGSASWKEYKAPSVSGYTASPKKVAKEKVYSWSKNKTVKVKYKKKSSKQTAQTASSSNSDTSDSAQSESTPTSSSDNSKTTSSTSESKKVNPWTEEKSVALRQEVLKVINDFRSQVGLPAVTLNNDFNDILDARSFEKFKFMAKNHCDVNHDGDSKVQEEIDKRTNNKFLALETLAPEGCSEYDSDQKQIAAIVDDYKAAMQGEKDDYEAIYINHTRKNITNYCGTVGHYGSLINWKGDSDINWTDNATQVAIGVACYGPSGVMDENYSGIGNGICLVIEMLYPRD